MSPSPDEKFCASCGNTVKKDAVICPSCGVNTDSSNTGSAKEVYCSSCGESIKAKAEICPSCGVSQGSSLGGGSSDLSGADVDSDLLRYVQIGLGALFILAALGSVMDPSGGAIPTLGSFLVYGLIGLLLIPEVRNNIEKNHPISTLGWEDTVRDKNVSASGKTCAICHDPVKSGVHRSFGKDLVVFGFTLWFNSEGANHYCSSCQNTEIKLDQSDPEMFEEL